MCAHPLLSLQTVMEDVYYEEHDDHSKLERVEQSKRSKQLQKQYKAPSPWGADTAGVDDVDKDDYYYVDEAQAK